LDEAVGAAIDDLIDPEAAPEVGDLDHHGREVERECPEPVDDVLVGARDETFCRIDGSP